MEERGIFLKRLTSYLQMGTCCVLQNTFYWPGSDGLEILYGEKTDFWRYWKNISWEVAKFYQIWN